MQVRTVLRGRGRVGFRTRVSFRVGILIKVLVRVKVQLGPD